MAKRWKHRPEGSNWGDFGEDDQLGSLNYIRPDDIQAAAATVRHGRAFCLSLPLDYPGGRVLAPHRSPPRLMPTERHGRDYFNYSFRGEGQGYCDVGCDDQVTLSTQYSTQWDSLAHIGHEFDLWGRGSAEMCFYNGYVAGQDILAPVDRGADYVMPLGIDGMAATPIQGRGLLIDIERHYGREARTIGMAEMQAMLDADGIVPRQGDILCLHTGFADELLRRNRRPGPDIHGICAVLDGTDHALLDWLSDRKIAALAADNYAVERVAAGSCGDKFVPLHHHCLFKRGMPLGELWLLTPLAAFLRQEGRHDFLLTAPPLRLPGAVGSPVTPVATV